MPLMISPDCFSIYPIHIDSLKTISEGRKYSKSASIDSPKTNEIKLALEKLNISFEFEADKRHPRDDRTGRFKVAKKEERKKIISKLILILKEDREAKMNLEKQNKVPNLLNLVPRKKKKGGKTK